MTIIMNLLFILWLSCAVLNVSLGTISLSLKPFHLSLGPLATVHVQAQIRCIIMKYEPFWLEILKPQIQTPN